tara:strand:- start:404 stop:643 length:240 start_codon:yes stop_codon:yes gene_type:complete
MKFFCTAILAFLFSFLINFEIVNAEQIDNSNQIGKDSLDNIENIKDNEKSSKVRRDEGDIFGDEQTFPFVAGLGKNAAH